MKKSFPQLQRIGDLTAVSIKKEDIASFVTVLPTNREKCQSNINSLLDSTKKVGYHRFPLVYLDKQDKKFVLYDGNHYLDVLMQDENKDSVTFIVNEKLKTKEEATLAMIYLNNKGKRWTVLDFAYSFAQSGNRNYQIFLEQIKDIKSEVKFNIQLTILILAYALNYERTSVTKDFKNGKFKIVDKKRGDELLKNIDECKNYLEDTRQVSQVLLKLMLSEKKYNHKHMIKRLKTHHGNTKFSSKEKQLEKELQEVYAGK